MHAQEDDYIGMDHAFRNAASQFFGLSTDEIQRHLMQLGLQASSRQQLHDIELYPLQASAIEKVSGCVANVRVRTVVNADTQTLYIEGTSDAILSRGLLAVLTTTLKGQPCKLVLQVNPNSVTDKLGLRRALSPGRNDGLASMMRTIQRQIGSLLWNDTVANEPAVLATNSIALQHVPWKKQTVAVLLSGGVDSSVALNLLIREGYDVTAFYLKIWLEDELEHLGQCPWEDDFRVCQEVCEQTGVPLESISLQNEYKRRVISYTINEAQQGRTPNPDIMCNSRIKFGCFYDAISSRSFDYVASGHYARVEREGGRARLFRAPDPIKDQSYFLCALTQEQLSKVLFPLGAMQKHEVRAWAEEFKLPNRLRPDSQGLCFLGKVKFDDFLAAYLGERPGKLIDASSGDCIGRHRGIWYHTVGQRKGIGKVLDPVATSRGPWYVVAKDPGMDIVYCSNEYDKIIFSAARSEITVEDIHWLGGCPPAMGSFRSQMKVRHGPKLVSGTVTLQETGTTAEVLLDQKDSGLAPGQYVVFYEGEECLGGGVIGETHWNRFLLERDMVDSELNASTILVF